LPGRAVQRQLRSRFTDVPADPGLCSVQPCTGPVRATDRRGCDVLSELAAPL